MSEIPTMPSPSPKRAPTFLGRLAEAVRQQNWFAVALEMLIVVVGVFLGIQLGNWNADRADRRAYARALDRLDAEIETNLGILDDMDPDLAQTHRIARAGFDALRSCEDTEANRRAVDAALSQISGTYGLHLRRIALDELTTDPDLLAQQSPGERQRFADLLFTLDLMQGEARFAEFYPLEGRLETDPAVEPGEPRDSTFTYFGADFSRTRYPLRLGVPVSEACRLGTLAGKFQAWLGWQGNLPVASRAIRHELDETRALLARRSP